MLLSLWASTPGMRLDFGGVVRAYFRTRARRRVYVDLSREDHEEGMCGLLKEAMYGATDAAQNWELEFTDTRTEAGFKQGVYSACALYRKEKNVRALARGDDFVVGLARVWTGFVESGKGARR